MGKTGFTLFAFFVLVTFGLSLAAPVEDLAETAYDESETLPFQGSAPLLHNILQRTKMGSQSLPREVLLAASGSKLGLREFASFRARYSNYPASPLISSSILRC